MIAIRRLPWMALGLLPVLFAGMSALAQPVEELVYWPLVTDGTEHRRVSYPPDVGPLLVMAGTPMVIEARRARVDYWPITREYLASISDNSPPVEGSVEVIDSSGTVTAVKPEPYLISHPDGVGAGPSQLIRGEATDKFYKDYVATARSAVERQKTYQQLVAQHQSAVETWIRMAGERRADMPAPPPELGLTEPEPYRAYATEPRDAAIVSLPEGAYTLRIRAADGSAVPGSERRLISFGALRQGLGYVLRPENRWTQPLASFAPQEAIYTSGETDLFFQPVPVTEYQAQLFTRLFRPQSVDVADPSLKLWVPTPNREVLADGVRLALSSGGAATDALPLTSYRVAQLPGIGRGYKIEEFTGPKGGPLQPDFQAMRVDRNAPVTQIRLIGSDGGPIDASDRQIRHVTQRAEGLLFLPALIPLMIGLALRIRRRRSKGSQGGKRSAQIFHRPEDVRSASRETQNMGGV